MSASLCHGVVAGRQGGSRNALAISMGRIAAAPHPRAYPVDLRDHLIFPGLINAHDHLHLNAVPPLASHAAFANSYEWVTAFQAHFNEPQVVAALQVPKALRLRHGALKNLLAGTTCVAHHDEWHPLFEAADFPVTVLRDYGWSYALGWPGYGPPVQESFAATRADRPWMIHLAEGIDATARAELAQLDELGCLAANTVLIHGVGLGDQDIEQVIAAGAAVVWCPSSNERLLRRSLDPRRLDAAGRLTLGSDSRLSGGRDLLEELRIVALQYEFNDRQALQLVTTRAACILRLSGQGALEPGAAADLVIVEDWGGEAASLVGIPRNRIRAVVHAGIPRIADPDFAEWFAAAEVETVPVLLDGRPKLLAKSLAEPALLALEPGLELAVCRNTRHPQALAATGSR